MYPRSAFLAPLCLAFATAAIAGFCPQCGSKHEDGHRFCTNCGTKLGLVAATAPQPSTAVQPPSPAPGPPTAAATAKQLDIDSIEAELPEDRMALSFLKAVVEGKPYVGSVSRKYIYSSPKVFELEVASKKLEKSRPPEEKYFYEIRLLAQRESSSAGLFEKGSSLEWERWFLRIKKEPGRILGWLPKAHYDEPFVRRPRTVNDVPVDSAFSELNKWLEQRRKTDSAYRATTSSSVLAEFEEVHSDGALSIDRAFPFLHNSNVITSLLHLAGGKLGEKTLHLVAVRLTNHLDSPRTLRVRAQIQGISHEAVESITLNPGQTSEIGLSPALMANALDVGEKRPSAISLKVEEAGKPAIYEETERVELLPKNDFILDRRLFPFISTFVTPNDRLVDQLVIAAGNRVSSRSMAGYQKPAKGVIEEVQAIYETIAKLGVHYRSNVTSFLQDKQVSAQRITFPSESLAGTGANCIDGSVLLASAFEALGLRAAIIFGPGHAFVGVHPEREGDQILCIETTLLGTGSFQQAVTSASATFNKWAASESAVIIDVAKTRELGITPFPFRSDNPLVAERLRQLAGH